MLFNKQDILLFLAMHLVYLFCIELLTRIEDENTSVHVSVYVVVGIKPH